MSNTMKTIDDILLNYRASLHNNFDTNDESFNTAHQVILDWHNKEVERIIGENPLANDDDAKYNFPEYYNKVNNRHELSIEQRLRAKGEK